MPSLRFPRHFFTFAVLLLTLAWAPLPGAAQVPPGNFQTFIPHSASGGGFLTRLFVTNLTNNVNSVTVNRLDQSGNVVDSQVSALNGGGTLLVSDSENDRTQDITVEWFAIASDFPISASVLFDFDSASLGLTENFRTAVGTLAADPLTAFSLPVRVATVEVTVGMALANLDANSNTVTMKLLDEAGNIAAQDSITLQPFSQTAFSLQDRAAFSDIVLGVPEFIGTLAVTSDADVAALVVGNNLRQLFSLPVTPGTAK